MSRSGGGIERDFTADVSRNIVSGVTRVNALCTRSIATAFSSLSAAQDIWAGVNNEMTFPTADESWEMVSSSANDTVGGSGSETVTFTILNFAYAEIAAFTVNLNGTTPVTLPNAAAYAWLNGATTGRITSAAQRAKNQGDITIRVTGSAGDNTKVRGIIPAFTGNLSNAVYTVPIGKTLEIFSMEAKILSSGLTGTPRGADFRLNFRNPNGSVSAPKAITCTDMGPFTLRAETKIRVGQRFNFIPQCVGTSNNAMIVSMDWEGHLYTN